MFNFFKNLGLAFKNKTATAEALWKIIGPPIVLARKWSKVREKSHSTSYSGFTIEFMKDEYLTGYFSGYLNFMLINFFKISNLTDRSEIMAKVYTAFDPGHFTSTEIFTKTMELVTRHHGKKNTTQGMDHAFMTVSVLIKAREKDKFLKDPIYLKAKKFYESGELDRLSRWAKRVELQKKLMGSMAMDMGSGKWQKMEENQAIAFRIMELTFVKKLNQKFKIKILI